MASPTHTDVRDATAGCSPESLSTETAGQAAVHRCHDTRADAKRNHAQVLAAATAAFTAKGPDVALEEIARDAGVGIGTLYRHFPTREVLMGAVVRDAFERLRDRATEGLTADDPWVAVEDWVRAYLAFAATKRGLVAGIVLLKEADGEFGLLCDRMFGAVDALVARGQEAGLVRAGVSGRDLLHLTSSIAASADRSDDPALPERLMELALAGLRTTR